MALVTCPDCGGSVSDAAPACIHCGRPLAGPRAADPVDRRARDRAERAESTRRIAVIGYVLQVLTFLYFIPGIVAVVLAYTKRGEARGTWVESHLDWQIETFWISLWLAIGTIVVGFMAALFAPEPLVSIGAMAVVGGGATVWYIYRIIRGGLALNDGRPVG